MSKQPYPSDGKISVVIPCYRVTRHILDVLSHIGSEITRIYVVDDQCPDKSGDFVEANNTDPRVIVLRNPHNLGVGGAVMTGYRAAIADGMDVIVKIDGDGQMDPALIPQFVGPILVGEADYTKGNRFFNLDKIRSMPKMRLFGNAVLSLMTKLSSGYWNLFDPTNGYTAIHAGVARQLPMDKISSRYFFETDILFRLNLQRAVVVDVPMDARYGDEVSNLKISKIIGEFLIKHARNFCKRIFYNYYLRDLAIASLELPLGLLLLSFGTVYGCWHWFLSANEDLLTPPGTVMLSALPILMGLQFILAFLAYDIAAVPTRPQHRKYSLHRAYVDADKSE
ncbi:glycosyltransferase [Undibacterium sp. RTI2.1]|uniref:glycosyltransferase n=1 Tax=unclassified Undibacterium TaxID=2630295 RepID=UPI002AB4F48C|nr:MULTISPECIES: glycosyltransferase [unclassified Undibacterium]MDY7539959.1 glycosyltransferase [Undibacterium sp. 5I1]MEB0032816.1 glycosyltransferase [Undibacterium sp. RTI2.1]MEB0116470.1 glycosyltransferase [Undibacterium sp. RTI2.2]MEB0230566.1 glycosyltransferase [Undibacterium sp. 10I3]MEB0257264.1 glycosyltransferase [Undibacterium sp. 5I1]